MIHFTLHAFKAILTVVALTYVSLVIVAALLQRQMSYFPGNEAFVPSAWSLPGFEALSVRMDDGTTLTSWYHAPSGPGKLTIVFFQGNAGHFGFRNAKFQPWLDAGYGLLLASYPGYNGNPGRPTEEGLYASARAAISALDKLNSKQESSLVFYGESLGTGVAVQMATEFRVQALILEAPFTTFPDVGADHYFYLPVRWLMRDRYDSLSKIPMINTRLLWIHGEHDSVVPFKLGRKLFDTAREPKEAHIVPNADHNDLYDFDAQEAVLRFLGGI
jgi:uncharacterized protein